MPNRQVLFAKLRLCHQVNGRIVAFGARVYMLAAVGLLEGKKVPGDDLHLAPQWLNQQSKKTTVGVVITSRRC
ncbi:MAG: hypothetical protein ACI9FJ_001285 [Alteromonadaceae bacterium]|jgi:hypothetical protein